jgi:hypothetical protein
MLSTSPYPDLPAAQSVSEAPGIIVLSMTRQILHANQWALGLVRLLSVDSSSPMLPDKPRLQLPPSLLEFAEQVLIHLEKRIAAEEWTQFEVKQLLRVSGQEFLLRGFGLPDKARRQQSRILLTMQASACPSAA